jgi:hypothetical protein
MDSNKDYKLFVIYNDIIKEDNKYYLKKEVTAIPVKFIVSSKHNMNLQKAFSYVRKLLIQSRFNHINYRNLQK